MIGYVKAPPRKAGWRWEEDSDGMLVARPPIPPNLPPGNAGATPQPSDAILRWVPQQELRFVSNWRERGPSIPVLPRLRRAPRIPVLPATALRGPTPLFFQLAPGSFLACAADAPREIWLFRIAESVPPEILGDQAAILTHETRLAVRKWLGEN